MALVQRRSRAAAGDGGDAFTGDWAVVFLLLLARPDAGAGVFDWMPLVQIRRRIGVAAALYAGVHFLIYVADQKWNLVVVATEIIKRFYLTIGFVALLALAALAITSTNGWQRRLRRNWKRLHWLVYPAAVLAILHFFIQSKANVGEATVAAGLFAWLMIWRWMPATPAHALVRPCCCSRSADPGRPGLRGRVVLAGEVSRSDAHPQGRHRSRPRAPADAEGPAGRSRGDRPGRTPASHLFLKRLWTSRYIRGTIPTS